MCEAKEFGGQFGDAYLYLACVQRSKLWTNQIELNVKS
jgi:hypothetical protein